MAEIVRGAVGGAEEEGDFGEGGATERSVRGYPRRVFRGAPVELGEDGAAERGDGLADGGFQGREGRGVVVGIGFGVGIGRGIGFEGGDWVEEGERGAGEGVAAGGGEREDEGRRRVSGGGGFAEDVSDEIIGKGVEDGGDGVRFEERIPFLDLA